MSPSRMTASALRAAAHFPERLATTRSEKLAAFCGVGAAQLREYGADGKLLFIDGVFQREPREVVERGAPRVVRPKGEETARHLVAQPLADQTDDAVHVEVRRAVGLEGKKLRLKLIVAAGGPDQIDGAALVGAVAVGFHISR